MSAREFQNRAVAIALEFACGLCSDLVKKTARLKQSSDQRADASSIRPRGHDAEARFTRKEMLRFVFAFAYLFCPAPAHGI